MGWSSVNFKVLEVFATEFILRHKLSQQVVILYYWNKYQKFRLFVQYVAIGVRSEVTYETSVIFDVLEQEFLACEERVFCVDNDADVAILYVNLRISVQRGVLSPDGSRYFADHSSHRLKLNHQVRSNMRWRRDIFYSYTLGHSIYILGVGLFLNSLKSREKFILFIS